MEGLMRSWTRILFATVVIALLTSVPLAAQKSKLSISATASSGTQIAIESVAVDLANESLTIYGDNFGTQAPRLFLFVIAVGCHIRLCITRKLQSDCAKGAKIADF